MHRKGWDVLPESAAMAMTSSTVLWCTTLKVGAYEGATFLTYVEENASSYGGPGGPLSTLVINWAEIGRNPTPAEV